MAMDVGNSIKLAQRSASTLLSGQVITVADGDNKVALTVNQNDVTNNPDALVITNTGTGNSIEVNTNEFIVDSSGNVTVGGNLTVNGTTTTINTVTWTVDDKNIEIGSVAVPSDTTADGGGITLKGTTDKTIIWDDTNDNWTFNQAVNVESGLTYKINNVDINTGGTLSNVAYLDQANAFNANQTLDHVGASANSSKIIFEADNSSTAQTGSIFVAYGADPYMRISVPNGSGAETATIDINDTAITFPTDNTVDIGASGANRPKDLYMSGNGTFAGNIVASDGTLDSLNIDEAVNIGGGSVSEVAYGQTLETHTSGTYGGISMNCWGDGPTFGQILSFNKSRSDTIGTDTIIKNNDFLGYITFNGCDGNVFKQAASICGLVDGTPGVNDMPGRLIFRTTPDGSFTPKERLRINSSGVLNVNGESVTEARLGQLLETHTSANYGGISMTTWSNNDTMSGVLDFNKSRSDTIGTDAATVINDTLGHIIFRGNDGGGFETAAMIKCQHDGVVSNNDTPGRLMFFTTPDGSNSTVENMRIACDGGIFFQNLGTLSGQSDVQYDTSTKELGYVSSSLRYKDNIRTDIDTDWLYNIDVKMYDRIDGSRLNEVGLIAEDLEQLKPELCAYNELGQVETYSNLGIVPYLLKEIQNLKEEIEQLKNN